MIPVVLHGQTGCGKTRLLQELSARGFPVIDLESLANHRGSAFGQLNIQGPQPSQESFDKNVEVSIAEANYSKFIFLEFEFPNLGKISIPDRIKLLYEDGIHILIETEIHQRVQYILEDYLPAGKIQLMECLNRLRDRIDKGQETFLQLKSLLESEQYKEFCYQVLKYYDNSKNYNQSFHYDFFLDDQGSKINADNLLSWINSRFFTGSPA